MVCGSYLLYSLTYPHDLPSDDNEVIANDSLSSILHRKMALDWWPDVTRWQSLDILVSSLSLLACYALLPRKPPTRATTTTCTTTDSATSTDSQTPHHSYIFPSYIHHARMLPKDSTHVFKYRPHFAPSAPSSPPSPAPQSSAPHYTPTPTAHPTTTHSCLPPKASCRP